MGEASQRIYDTLVLEIQSAFGELPAPPVYSQTTAAVAMCCSDTGRWVTSGKPIFASQDVLLPHRK